MEKPYVVAVDLDDTLIETGKFYNRAREEFAEYAVESLELPVSTETVEEMNVALDSQRAEEYGLSKERFPESMQITYKQLAEQYGDTVPTDEMLDSAYQIGWEVVDKPAEAYAAEGFIDGAQTFLDRLEQRGIERHLITAGDERVQQPKIDGVQLDRWFDEKNIHIVPDDKTPVLETLTDTYGSENVWMVGNSLSSDIEPAQSVDAGAVHMPHYEWDYDQNHNGIDREHPRFTTVDTVADLSDLQFLPENC